MVSKSFVGLFFSFLVLGSLSLDIERSKELVSSLIDSNKDAGVQFLLTLLDDAQNDEEKCQICSYGKEKLWRTLDTGDDKVQEFLEKCLDVAPVSESGDHEFTSTHLMAMTIKIYQANLYANYQAQSTPCFSAANSNGQRIDSGLMAVLDDICIVEIDGLSYIRFYSPGTNVFLLGSSLKSYKISYQTESEKFMIVYGEYTGGIFYQQGSLSVLSMFLQNVYETALIGALVPKPLEPSWIEFIDISYSAGIEVQKGSQNCLVFLQGRLADTEICVAYSASGTVFTYANGSLVSEDEGVVGPSVIIQYSTWDDVLVFKATLGKVLFSIISSEILFVANVGTIPETGGETLSISLEYSPTDPSVVQYECMNLYNDQSGDYVLNPEVNILCVFCDHLPNSNARCGISLYSKERASSYYSILPIIEQALTLTYETSSETITVALGEKEVSFYADEIFYYLYTMQDHTLHSFYGFLEPSGMTGLILTSNCLLAENAVGAFDLGGYSAGVTCEETGCYIGVIEDGTFLATKRYEGEFTTMRTYFFAGTNADSDEYCLSFVGNLGTINHCLMLEQVQMYMKSLSSYPILTLG